MGLCAAKNAVDAEEEKRNYDIEKANKVDKDKERKIQKLLLLGAGESGKSTIFKQIIDLYGAGFSQLEIEQYHAVVHTNTLQSMVTLVNQAKELAPKFSDLDIKDDLKSERDLVLNANTDDVIPPDVADAIKKLWAHPAIKNCYARRSMFQLPVSAAYFFEKIDEIIKPDWLPKKQDILQTRVRTTGVLETAIEYQGFKLKLIDVGGQRSERKKWIGCFSGVDAVIFVAAISEYDQKLFEDEKVDRLVESLNIFEEISNLDVFKASTFMLFLNKSDLFREKLTKVPLKNFLPDYDGSNEFEPACQFIADKYLARKRGSKEDVYVQITCATDDSNVTFVFNTVRDIVIKKALQTAGLDL